MNGEDNEIEKNGVGKAETGLITSLAAPEIKEKIYEKMY